MNRLIQTTESGFHTSRKIQTQLKLSGAVFILLMVCSFKILASACFVYCDSTSCHTDSIITFNNIDLSKSQNSAGETAPVSPTSTGPTFELNCYQQNFYWMYATSLPVENSRIVINDYMSLDFSNGTNLSFSEQPRADILTYHYTPGSARPDGHGDDHWATRYITTGRKTVTGVYIRKPFVGHIIIPKTLVYTIYANTNPSDPLTADKYISNVYLTGDVNVPQSCEIDTGKTIEFDFGNIAATSFSRAGAGNKPNGVNAQTRTIGIQCKNMEANALLSMRLEANDTSGNAMVSDNKDLGFVIADQRNSPLTPNNINSTIPFQLDDSAAASLPITAWPVSITGNKPAEGKFTAEGYLRVDFD